MLRLILHISLLLTVVVSSSRAQYDHLKFRSLTKLDGLSSTSAYCITSDKSGYVWIGTPAGLNKYDGLNIVNYAFDINDSTSLSSSNIFSLLVDRNNNLWIGTNQGGFCKYNRLTDNFTRIPVQSSNNSKLITGRIKTLVEHSNGEIWIGTKEGDLCIYNPQNNTFRTFEDAGIDALKKSALGGISEDESGNMWVCRRRPYIDIYDPQKGLIEQLPMPYLNRTTEPSHDKILLFDSEGLLWIATSGLGLFTYDRNNKKFHEIKGINGPSIIDVLEIGDKIAVASAKRGLDIIDKKTLKIKHYNHRGGDGYSLSGNDLSDLHLDHRGILWITSPSGGVNIYNPLNHKFTHYYPSSEENSLSHREVTELIELSDSTLLIGTNGGGLNIFDPATQQFSKPYYGTPNDLVNRSRIMSLYLDENDLYVSAYGEGISKVDLNNGSVTNFSNSRPEDIQITSLYVTDIIKDAKGSIWFASSVSFLNRYWPKRHRRAKRYNFGEPDFNQSIHKAFYVLHTDLKKKLWAGNRDGYLCMFNYENRTFTTYPVGHDKETGNFYSINSIYQDSVGVFWLGTDGGGLRKFNSKTNKVNVFRMEDGLPSDIVYDILPDKNGNIWCSTMNGMFSFNLKTHKTLTFSKHDGLQENQFSLTSAVLATDGTMYFGGVNGLNSFKPDHISKDSICEQLVFTDFKILNKSARIGEDRTLKKHISFTDEISLSHKENVFTISFILINYINPDQVKYEYIMEGFDNEWRSTDNRGRHVTYTNLNGGRYHFKVRAINHDGFECSDPLDLAINIIPPFYKTLLFKILVGLFVLSLIVSIYFLRIQILHQQKKQLEEQVKNRTNEIRKQKSELERHKNNLEELVAERTLDLQIAKEKAEESDRLKSSFLANMSHEIRTPLNAIIGFSGLLMNPKIEETKKDRFTNLIKKSSQTLINLINDIIDISKIEAGQMTINKKNINVIDFLLNIHTEYNNKLTLLDDTNIELVKDLPDKVLVSHCDPLRLRQIVVNFLENAIKFTPQGSITIKAEEIHQDIKISVTDTGIGISKKHQEFVFERFTKVEDMSGKLYRGTGLGLFICKRLAMLLGGDIGMTSKVGKGSSFWFTIPKSDAAYEADEKQTEFNAFLKLNWENKRILIVDDETENLLYLKTVLEETKADCLEANNGAKAIKIAMDNPDIDVILMDIKMPVIDGLEATRQIRKTNKKVAIIAQTAYAMTHDKDLALKAGCNDYLTKPINHFDLLSTIEQYM